MIQPGANARKEITISPLALASTAELTAAVEEARNAIRTSFEQFCLMAGAREPDADAGERRDGAGGARDRTNRYPPAPASLVSQYLMLP